MLQHLDTPPDIVDVHVHHNGHSDFLRALHAKLEAVNGIAFLLTTPPQMKDVSTFIAAHPGRLLGFADVRLDDPAALTRIDQFAEAGFTGLGEFTSPLHPYDDERYWPIYERAQTAGLLTLFHTGIVNRLNPDVPSNISSERMRITHLEAILRQFPRLCVIAAHLGNPDYAWAAELARWNPNLYLDLTGTTLIKTQRDYSLFHALFWWSDKGTPHSPSTSAHAFERIVFGSDIFGGELEEFDRSLERYQRLLHQCALDERVRRSIMAGTMWKILGAQGAARQPGASA